MEFGVDAEMTKELTAELRKRTNRLLIMKLSPSVQRKIESTKEMRRSRDNDSNEVEKKNEEEEASCLVGILMKLASRTMMARWEKLKGMS